MSTSSQLLNSTMPRDLRSGGPADAGAGKTYQVDPAAVARLKQYITQKQASAPVTAPPAASPTAVSAEPTPGTTGPDPAALYPAAVIAAAREQEQATGRRNLASVLTDDVLAVWDRWNNDGMSMNAISKKANNGLIELAQSEVRRYLLSYRERLAQPAAAAPEAKTAVPSISPGRKAVVVHRATGAEPAPTEPATAAPAPAAIETAVHPSPTPGIAKADDPAPLPKPEVEALETAVEPFTPQRPENLPPWLDRQWAPPPPAPRPGDALAALASLVNNEQLRIKGSVKLNLEIEFGK